MLTINISRINELLDVQVIVNDNINAKEYLEIQELLKNISNNLIVEELKKVVKKNYKGLDK